MAEVVLSLPDFNKLQLELPLVLFRLAEQVSAINQECMTMTVTRRNGSTLGVNLQKTIDNEEERLLLDITAPTGDSVLQASGDLWRVDLGNIQSPVYFQTDDKGTRPTQMTVTVPTVSPDTDLQITAPSSLIVHSPTDVNGKSLTCLRMTEAPSEHSENLAIFTTLDGQEMQSLESETQERIDLEYDPVERKDVEIELDANECLVDMLPAEDKPDKLLEDNQSGLSPHQITMEIPNTDVEDDLKGHVEVKNEQTSQDNLDQNTLGEEDLENLHHLSDEPQPVIIINSDITDKTLAVLPEHDLDLEKCTVYTQRAVDGDTVSESEVLHVLTVPAGDWWQTDQNGQIVSIKDVNTLQHVPNVSIQDVVLQTVDSDKVITMSPSPTLPKRQPSVVLSSGEIALESSLQVQSTKDIPRIIKDIQANKCPLCHKVYATVKVLTGHFVRKHPDMTLNESDIQSVVVKDAHLCYICHKPFVQFDSVRKHLETIHKMDMERRKIIRLYSCPICFTKHTSFHTVRCHLNYKHRQHPQYRSALVTIQTQMYTQKAPKRPSSVLLQCPWCNVNFTMKQFRYHVHTAHTEEPDKESIITEARKAVNEQKMNQLKESTRLCLICKVEFPKKSYHAHMRRVHCYSTKPMDTKCTECGKHFGSKWHLNMHMTIHKDLKEFKCDTCSRAFRNKYALQKHVDTIHKGVYRHVCETCKRGFHTRRMIANHACYPESTPWKPRSVKRKHSEDPSEAGPDPIPIDNQNTEGNVKDFIKNIESSNMCQCTICEKTFPGRTNILAHLRRVHRVSRTPIVQYQCTQCPKKFILQSKLTAHMVIHGDRTHQCQHCPSCFKTAHSLKNHVDVMHYGIYRFYCDKCGRSFQKQSYVRDHLCRHPGHSKPGVKEKLATSPGDDVNTDNRKLDNATVSGLSKKSKSLSKSMRNNANIINIKTEKDQETKINNKKKKKKNTAVNNSDNKNDKEEPMESADTECSRLELDEVLPVHNVIKSEIPDVGEQGSSTSVLLSNSTRVQVIASIRERGLVSSDRQNFNEESKAVEAKNRIETLSTSCVSDNSVAESNRTTRKQKAPESETPKKTGKLASKHSLECEQTKSQKTKRSKSLHQDKTVEYSPKVPEKQSDLQNITTNTSKSKLPNTQSKSRQTKTMHSQPSEKITVVPEKEPRTRTGRVKSKPAWLQEYEK